MFRALALVLMLHSLTFAQNTWRGLRFGMSEDEAQKVYEGTLRKLSEEDVRNTYSPRFKEAADSKDMLEDADQKLEEMPARARLVFDKRRKTLEEINLTANAPFADRAAGTEAVVTSLVAISMLNRDFAEKYGKPVTENGECNLTVAMANHGPPTFSCDKMWKSEGQTVSMRWYFFEGRLQGVFLIYKPLPRDI